MGAVDQFFLDFLQGFLKVNFLEKYVNMYI